VTEASLRMAPWQPQVRLWRRAWGGGRFLPVGWPLYALFLGLPVWWLLGVSLFMGPLLAVPLALSLAGSPSLRVPRGFGLWLLFLLWMVVTATQLEGIREWGAFTYRASGYVAATIVFLYVLNVPRQLLPSHNIVKVMAAFWVVTVAGGLLGTVLPAFTFTTPAELVLPAALLEDGFVQDMVQASTSSATPFAAYPIHRPKAPFPYTNMWASVFSLTLPFAIAALRTVRRRWRTFLIATMVASAVPFVFSLSRGAWVSVGLAGVYALFRVMGRGKARILLGILLGFLVLGFLLSFTPLGEIIQVRLDAGYSDEGRLTLYRESLRLTGESPGFGFGVPQDIPGLPSAGTHGQFWTVIVSHGIPGALLFVAWLTWAWFRSGRHLWRGVPRSASLRFWTHLVITVALGQLLVYSLLPWGMPVVMLAAGLFWREMLAESDTAAGGRLDARSPTPVAVPVPASRRAP
jgi:polysaccharide biosynthesis protein PslJ